MKDWADANAARVDIRAYAAEQIAKDIHKKANGHKPPAASPVPNFKTWMARELPEPDCLMGTWLTTTSRVLLTGPTGLGKTMLGLALAIAQAVGNAFLHWPAGRACTVLYIDGEMSRREMQRRLRDEAERAGVEPEALFILSREDFEDMPPLNTDEGQKWMNAKIDEVNPDIIIFDNIQALIAGDHGKEESWAPVLPWMWSLTRRHIAQIWMHHTGHNEGHSYGTKTREWQMDSCILLKRIEDESGETKFVIEFTKARERTPKNRSEFDSVAIALKDNKWQIVDAPKAAKGSMPDAAEVALGLLKKAVNEAGEIPATCNHIPDNTRCVKEEMWQKYCRAGSLTKGEGERAFGMAFSRAAEKLQARKKIGVWNGWVWPIT